MIITEIGLQNITTRHAFVSPFTIKFTVNIKTLAPFWLNTFSCPDDTTDKNIYILSVIANYSDRFSRVNSLSDCKNLFRSWVFIYDEQALYINIGPTYNQFDDIYEYLNSVGFCDLSVVYIDDVSCLPVITSAPNISQSQDMIAYDKLAYNTGSIAITNTGGNLDYLRRMDLFANDVYMSYLKYDGRDEYDRSELQPLAHFLIDNISIGKRIGKITLQDARASNNVSVPVDLFTSSAYPNIEDRYIDSPIPITFGSGVVSCICTNGKTTSSDVYYRASLEIV